jgi:hypothetical protein
MRLFADTTKQAKAKAKISAIDNIRLFPVIFNDAHHDTQKENRIYSFDDPFCGAASSTTVFDAGGWRDKIKL